jgi:serine/threonine-protein kinase RsbW
MAVAKQEISREEHEFDDKVVSAIGEAFNNVAIHAYRGNAAGRVDIEFEFEFDSAALTVRLLDTGEPFDPGDGRPLDMNELHESGMGLYIVRECMDGMSYRRGNPPTTPNVLTLTKHVAKTRA